MPDNTIIATLDVCSLYANIPQAEKIKVVCQYYNEHYQPNPPIPTAHLGDLMKPILKESSFFFKVNTSCRPTAKQWDKNGSSLFGHLYGPYKETFTPF